MCVLVYMFICLYLSLYVCVCVCIHHYVIFKAKLLTQEFNFPKFFRITSIGLVGIGLY